MSELNRLRQSGTVSVVIPVRNESQKIAACLDAIHSQSICPLEIIVVDSGSTDGTLEILARYEDVRVISVPFSEFNHGESRNVGVRAAKGDWVLMTVGDARAMDDYLIEQLLAGVVDEEVAGVCGSQIVPHERDANPADWFKPVSAPITQRIQFGAAEQFDALAPSEKLVACSWDDVCALYRRPVLLEIPFRPIVYGEDSMWANDALRAGFAIVYQQGARVYHYHFEDAQFTFRRTILTLCFRYNSFGYVYSRPPLVARSVRIAIQLILQRALPLGDRMRWIVYNVRNYFAVRAAWRMFDVALRSGKADVERLCAGCSVAAPSPAKFAVGSVLRSGSR
jgi:rhamnosyltransferase